MGRRESRRGREGKKGMGEENLKKWDSRDREQTETESKERDILIEGAIIGLARNLALEKFPGIHKDDLN